MDTGQFGRAGAAAVPADRRLSIRRPVHMRVRVVRSAYRRDEATVSELSVEGCRIDNLRAAVGEAISLKFDTLDLLSARVAWCAGETTGCQFDRPLHPAVFDHLTTRYAL